MLNVVQTLLLVFLSNKINGFSKEMLDREKRFLVFPPTSPTRHQLISGIGIPVTSESESVTLGWVIKAQYFLPETADQLKPTYAVDFYTGNYTSFPLRWKPFPFARRRRDVEIENVDVKEIGSMNLIEEEDEEEFDDDWDDEFPDESQATNYNNFDEFGPDLTESSEKENEILQDRNFARWAAYEGLTQILNRKGFEGRLCVLRGICEAAETKFSIEGGLFSELMHILFTPSTTSEKISNSLDYDYMKAEQLGGSGAPCSQIFHECKLSILDVISKIYE